MSLTVPGSTNDLARRTVHRVAGRLMPFLLLLYVVAYLDRVNVGYAKLRMTDDLGFSAGVFGLGAGLFFIGYFLLEIPGTILVESWSARSWFARIMKQRKRNRENDSAKNPRSSFESLRTNGRAVQHHWRFSVHAEPSRSIPRVFQRNRKNSG